MAPPKRKTANVQEILKNPVNSKQPLLRLKKEGVWGWLSYLGYIFSVVFVPLWIINSFCTYAGNGCPADKPLRNGFGRCVSCDALDWSIYDPDCELRCPNRITWAGGACAWKECPENAPLRRNDGACWKCDYELGISLEKTEECKKVCPNRMLWKSDSKFYNNECVLKECPKGTIRGKSGDCGKCESYAGVGDNSPLNAQECEKCGLIGWECPTCTFDKLQCVPKKCLGDLRDIKGKCECDNSMFTVDDPKKCALCDFEVEGQSWQKGKWICRKKENRR